MTKQWFIIRTQNNEDETRSGVISAPKGSEYIRNVPEQWWKRNNQYNAYEFWQVKHLTWSFLLIRCITRIE